MTGCNASVIPTHVNAPAVQNDRIVSHAAFIDAMKREYYPVATRLLPAKARRGIQAFYAFARYGDDIADHPQWSPEEKSHLLSQLATLLTSTPECAVNTPVHGLLCAASVQPALLDYASDMLHAFTMDCRRISYETADMLDHYSRYSAVPFGRAVLTCCGESEADIAALEHLCIALQWLNHIRDIHADYTTLNRIYLPQDWLVTAGVTPAMLCDARSIAPPLQRVIGQALGHTAQHLQQAARLPASLSRWQLRVEAKACIAIAWWLHDALQQRKCLTSNVKYSHLRLFLSIVRGYRPGRVQAAMA